MRALSLKLVKENAATNYIKISIEMIKSLEKELDIYYMCIYI